MSAPSVLHRIGRGQNRVEDHHQQQPRSSERRQHEPGTEKPRQHPGPGRQRQRARGEGAAALGRMAPVGGQVDQIVEHIDRRGHEAEGEEGKQRRADIGERQPVIGDHRQEDEHVLDPLMRPHRPQHRHRPRHLRRRAGARGQQGRARLGRGFDRVDAVEVLRHPGGEVFGPRRGHHHPLPGFPGAAHPVERVAVVGQGLDLRFVDLRDDRRGCARCAGKRRRRMAQRPPVLAQRLPEGLERKRPVQQIAIERDPQLRRFVRRRFNWR